MTNRVKNNLLGVLIALICLIILNIAYNSLANISLKGERNRYRYIAMNEANYISSCIDKVVVRTYTIREMLNENDGSTDFFDKVAPVIRQSVKKDTGITLRNIAVAPNGIVEKVSPLETNETLVGFNFTDETKPGNKEAIEAYKKANTIITNPFPLIQGGIGMAARTPVFITSNQSQNTSPKIAEMPTTKDFAQTKNSQITTDSTQTTNSPLTTNSTQSTDFRQSTDVTPPTDSRDSKDTTPPTDSPIITDSELSPNYPSHYWGLVTVTMDFDDVVRAFNFDTFTKMHIDYSLWYQNDAGEKIVLAGSTTELPDCVTEEVKVFNLNWNLDVIPSAGWRDKNIDVLSRLAILIISLLISALLMLIFKVKRDGALMKNLAEKDTLTHCYSRYYLNSVLLDNQTNDWKNPENNYSVAIIDIDNFKNINDTYGHISGDRALVAIANVLQNNINNSKKDKVIRFGGDEFVVFFSNIERKDLRIKFQDILSAVEKIQFDDIPELKLTISAGVAIPEFVKSTNYKVMMKRADENLYKVKQNGRNNYAME
ncbi:MAG: diguanylate cyclase [Treponema sp.]|nr:diguanylate cyclase [Treponema sp.]